MKTLARFHHRFSRFNIPAATLIALLQRTPVVRIAAIADEYVASSPLGAILKSAVAAIGALGAIDSLAGATTLSASQNSPVSATAGTPITSIAFTVTNTINIGSWAIGGSLPPGLSFMAAEGGAALSAPGTLDATTPGTDDGYGNTSGGISTTTPVLQGTPTTPGNYTITLRAYEYGSGDGGALSGLASNTFSYTVNVVANTSAAPSFTTQPSSQTVTTGSSVTFTVVAAGSPTPTYQWKFNANVISGATSASYTIASATSANAGTYTCVATNSIGNLTSAGATLTVNAAPVAPTFTLTASPATTTVASGRTVVFNAIATGSPAPTYQWTFNGSPTIPGASVTNDPILMVTGTTSGSAGTYTCTATNIGGTATTSATLSIVTSSNPGYLNNVSALGYVGAGAGILIGGFNIVGTGGKEILVRGIGPGLNTTFGLSGYVVNPYAELFSGNSPVQIGGSPVQNDDWGTPDYPGAPVLATVTTAMATLGAYSLPPASTDAAILVNLPNTGGYTVQVSGVGGGTGTGVVEIYDADSGAPGVRLNNLSARDLVETGQNILIGGFSIAGGTDETVLIRAVGPGLNSTFGLTGILAQPVLTLFHGPTQIYANTAWGGDPILTAAQATVGAYPLVPSSADSLLLVTLPPGGYTAQVTGLNSTIGIAVVEVYEVQ